VEDRCPGPYSRTRTRDRGPSEEAVEEPVHLSPNVGHASKRIPCLHRHERTPTLDRHIPNPPMWLPVSLAPAHIEYASYISSEYKRVKSVSTTFGYWAVTGTGVVGLPDAIRVCRRPGSGLRRGRLGGSLSLGRVEARPGAGGPGVLGLSRGWNPRSA